MIITILEVDFMKPWACLGGISQVKTHYGLSASTSACKLAHALQSQTKPVVYM